MSFADDQQRMWAFKQLTEKFAAFVHHELNGEWPDLSRVFVMGIPALELTTAATMPGHEPDLSDWLRHVTILHGPPAFTKLYAESDDVMKYRVDVPVSIKKPKNLPRIPYSGVTTARPNQTNSKLS